MSEPWDPPTVRGFTTPPGRAYLMNEHDTIQALEAENTLMNELVSDQKRRIEELEAAVNKAVRVLIDRAGLSVTEARNFFPPSVFESTPDEV